MTNYIWITTTKKFIHNYPEAPEKVKFLRNKHRHLFHFRIDLEVKHENRDIEFIMFKKEIDKFLDERFSDDLGPLSCEMISDIIAFEIAMKHPDRDIIIEVSEDGENGSKNYYEKHKL